MKNLPIQKKKNEWKIHVNYSPGSYQVEVWLYQERDGKMVVTNFNTYGDMISNVIPEGQNPSEDIKPFMKLPMDAFELIAEAFADKAPKKDKDIVGAELKATKRHLQDMRTIVFKKYKNFELKI